MNSSTPRLEASIRAHLASVLREDGFAGSGRTYRRVVDDWVHVVNVQGSRHGGSFAINLAIHPQRVPDSIGRAVDPRKLTHDACELRCRLSEQGGDQWWECYGDQDSMNEAAQAAASVYVEHGRATFGKLGRGASSVLYSLTAKQLSGPMTELCGFGATTGRVALLFARLRAQQGRTSEAADFVALGLAVAGEAYLLRQELNAVTAAAA